MLISVCICTFRRPTLLLELLNAVGQQQMGSLQAQIQIVVVDNDPNHSARPVLESWRTPPGFSLVFVNEPEPNIAVARNTTVRLAKGDWIAFVDDDELPVSDWLLRLVETQQRFNADAVFGPVIPRYTTGIKDWIRLGGYFDRRRFPTGTSIDEADARTSNALVSAKRLRSLDGPFDQSFGRTGGEDSMLFRDLLALECRFVWSDEATVSEDVPMARANASWLLRRSLRVGQTWIRAELYRLPIKAKIFHGFVLMLRACVQLVVSGVLAVAWLPLSRIKAFHWTRTAAMQIGKITAMVFRYKEYGG
ncbi:MAG: Glycosyl transferase [Comamonadaceae bacterium]|nr:MAG: Glycosyl transferase [Comamonadaceae bacterium]